MNNVRGPQINVFLHSLCFHNLIPVRSPARVVVIFYAIICRRLFELFGIASLFTLYRTRPCRRLSVTANPARVYSLLLISVYDHNGPGHVFL
uniref:Uncharacterized protein n=1 Tax=Rhizophora mucronata TaxID=61149 RepID=A0A2P2QSG0_RHIMU